jgi:hypothetical protein
LGPEQPAGIERQTNQTPSEKYLSVEILSCTGYCIFFYNRNQDATF